MKGLRSEKISLKDIILNPFFMYALAFSGALLLYALKWVKYPELETATLCFLLFTVFLSILLGYLTIKKRKQDDWDFKERKLWYFSVYLTIFIVLGTAVTLIYAGKIPLFKILFPAEDYNYQSDFQPIRYFTLLLTSLNSALITLFCYLFLKLKDKRYLILLSVCLIIVALFGSRGLAFVSIFPSIFIAIYTIRWTRLRVGLMCILFILGAYIFGVYGDVRERAKIGNQADYSLYDSMHSDKYPSFLSGKFIWFYVYYTSPIAKFQYVINDEEVNSMENNFSMMFFAEMIPYSIAKRLFPDYELFVRASNKGLPSYFVGTAYDDLYLYGKWTAVFIYTAVLFLFLFFVMKNLRGSLPILAILCTLALFSVFDNMLSFSPLMFMLCWLLLLSCLTSKFFVKR